ncbi:DMT family transporter [Deinococcus apachensis]|uniref:DMT family transporter n=1 Tax=Deinococcus apachensis TaxID=309886 RepID=UPI0003AA08F5|nr:DMT family transporter [Deinococcus apachensis]
MTLLTLLGTVGAGLGLAAGLAFNLRLAAALGLPLAATLVNFVVGAALLLTLWVLGVDRALPAGLPPLWMFLGGAFGASYVALSLTVAARLGAGVSTVAVTLGQVLGALAVTGLGWLGQAQQSVGLPAVLSALCLLGAVVVLARDREQTSVKPPGR